MFAANYMTDKKPSLWQRIRGWPRKEHVRLGKHFTFVFHCGPNTINVKGYTSTDGSQTLWLDANGKTRFKVLDRNP